MENKSKIRVLYAREHTTIFPKLGVFLAGPTPPNYEMKNSWRRKIIDTLKNDIRLNPSMTIVAPEPETGVWKDIDQKTDNPELDYVLNKQIPWEWQYLNLCDITAFWLPTYWRKESAENFPANIGPTSRWEFGFYLQEYLKNPQKRTFIAGAPEDAESVKWAKKVCDIYGLQWHTLVKNDKEKLVADSFIEAIVQALLNGNWEY